MVFNCVQYYRNENNNILFGLYLVHDSIFARIGYELQFAGESNKTKPHE